MSLSDDIALILKAYEKSGPILQHNCELIDIYEGNLLEYVVKDLAKQLSEKSLKAALPRIAPVNLLRRVVDKTANIYSPEPSRRIAGGTPRDQELFDWYREHIPVNDVMTQGAEMYEMAKSSLFQPYAHEGKPALRVIQPDYFFVLSTDKVDNMRPTHVVTFDFEEKAGEKVAVFTAYTKDEILIFDQYKNIDRAAMAAMGNPEGINPIGALPFVYASASKFRLMPTPDSDLMRMTRLFPVLITDLNFAVMYQCFAIIWTKNLAPKEYVLSPNVMWDLQKDQSVEGDADIGTIKPEVDYDGVLTLVQSQLSIWLNSRGIRPGAIGKLDGDKFGSGIARMIDEMDTFEARSKLAARFQRIEVELWDLIMHKFHPYWVATGQIEMRELFSQDAKLEVVFPGQQPLTSRGQMVTDLKAEVDAGFTSRHRAIQALNPLMTEKEVEELEQEIAAEKAAGATEPTYQVDLVTGESAPEDEDQEEEEAA
jgi:hypothetical protein